jgi:sigma-54 dependent transcriptional regulator, acetoin dehydrogenase operon transcriptional activator AcoR
LKSGKLCEAVWGHMKMRHSFDISLIERHHKAREAVMNDSGLMPVGVDPAVVRGWQRCLSLGLEPDRSVVFQPVGRSLSRSVQEANAHLKSLAQQEVSLLARALASRGAIVVLADASLSVLHADGLQSSSAPELHLISRIGVDTSERAIGSNALSIAAAELSPVTVLQNAHFCTANAIFSCAGAPIRTPSGQLSGILDVTTAYRPLPGEALFLTAAAAKAIENAMFQPKRGEILIRCHPRAEFINTPMAALVMVNDAGEVTAANEAALQLFSLRWPLRQITIGHIVQTALDEVLRSVGQGSEGHMQLISVTGVPLAAQISVPRGSGLPAMQAAAPNVAPIITSGPLPASPLALGESEEVDRGSLRDVERHAIEQALSKYQGNIAAAARSLGVSRGTLYRRLRETK